MPLDKTLPKTVMSKLSSAEKTKLVILQADVDLLRIKMLDAQERATQSSRYDYSRIGKNSMATLKLNDKGFSLMASYMKCLDTYLDYKQSLRKKYVK